MPSPSRGPSRPSSYDAFASVDSRVAKPVLGSDNAAEWQSFRKDAGPSGVGRSGTATGAAPVVPIKRSDRLGSGFATREEEIRNERLVREGAGDAAVGSGYTSFKKKVDKKEIATKKRARLVAERVRPDDKAYFHSSETFDTWREDYVFTTRDRGTGYYWDGMDSVKKQLGLAGKADGDHGQPSEMGEEIDSTQRPQKKRKKKKKKRKETDDGNPEPSSVGDEDAMNPMEQVAQALRRRNEAMRFPPGTSTVAQDAATDIAGLTGAGLGAGTGGASEEQRLAAGGWEKALDPGTGMLYFFKRSSGERRWDDPKLDREVSNQNDQGLGDKARQCTKDSVEKLPDGWSAAKDTSSDKTYYYHAKSGKTQWTKPQ